MQIYVISLCAITLNNINWMRGINLFGFILQNWGWLLCVSSTIVSSIRSSVPLPNIKIGAHTQQKPAFPIAGWLLHQNVAPTSKFITACLLSRHSTLPSPPRLIVALFLFDDGGGHPSISLTIERWCRHVHVRFLFFGKEHHEIRNYNDLPLSRFATHRLFSVCVIRTCDAMPGRHVGRYLLLYRESKWSNVVEFLLRRGRNSILANTEPVLTSPLQ